LAAEANINNEDFSPYGTGPPSGSASTAHAVPIPDVNFLVML
jgi:hypothetical protein